MNRVTIKIKLIGLNVWHGHAMFAEMGEHSHMSYSVQHRPSIFEKGLVLLVAPIKKSNSSYGDMK